MSSRVNITSRRTLSESSEAEGTVTYNRELFLPGLGPAGHLSRGGEHSQHVSPTGSEVIQLLFLNIKSMKMLVYMLVVKYNVSVTMVK